MSYIAKSRLPLIGYYNSLMNTEVTLDNFLPYLKSNRLVLLFPKYPYSQSDWTGERVIKKFLRLRVASQKVESMSFSSKVKNEIRKSVVDLHLEEISLDDFCIKYQQFQHQGINVKNLIEKDTNMFSDLLFFASYSFGKLVGVIAWGRLNDTAFYLHGGYDRNSSKGFIGFQYLSMLQTTKIWSSIEEFDMGGGRRKDLCDQKQLNILRYKMKFDCAVENNDMPIIAIGFLGRSLLRLLVITNTVKYFEL